jgi:hypothetical protein
LRAWARVASLTHNDRLKFPFCKKGNSDGFRGGFCRCRYRHRAKGASHEIAGQARNDDEGGMGSEGDFVVVVFRYPTKTLRMRLRIKSAMTTKEDGNRRGFCRCRIPLSDKNASHEIADQVRNDDEGGMGTDGDFVVAFIGRSPMPPRGATTARQ